MMGVLDVRIVSDEGEALHVLLTLIGPLLISGAAVFAARTARNSAAERQQRQLTHDTERQEEALAHDRVVRNQELTHDREVRKKERARDTLDSVLESLNNARVKNISLNARVSVLEELGRETGAKADGAPDAIDSAARKRHNQQRARSEHYASESWNARRALNGDWARLILRFGPEHEVTRAFKRMRRALNGQAELANLGLNRPFTDEEQERAQALSNQVARRFDDFTTACRKWDAT